MASILALGDSYTIGEGVIENQNFPNQFAHYLAEKNTLIELKIVAKTGWRTDNLLDAIRLINLRTKFDYVFLLIGVNNQFQNKNKNIFENELILLIKKSILFAKNIQNVFVLSIPNYGHSVHCKHNSQKITTELAFFNDIIKKSSEKYNLKYIDINLISKTEEKQDYASDELHPSAFQYKKWVLEIINFL